MSHRKQVKHYEGTVCVHELTFSCYQRLPLLTNNRWRKILGVALERAVERHAYRLVAFVFMPEHVHLLVLPANEECRVANLLRAIKRPTSYRIKKLLEEGENPLLKQLTVRQRPGVSAFRFWQEGPGYDRNLDSPPAIKSAIDYIHLNPVRRGLCSRAVDWRWSSARQYSLDTESVGDGLPRIHVPWGMLE